MERKQPNRKAPPICDYPSPIEPNYGIRRLIPPHEKHLPESTTEVSSSVMWTRMEQSMYDLQVSAAETHGNSKNVMEDPYPQ